MKKTTKTKKVLKKSAKAKSKTKARSLTKSKTAAKTKVKPKTAKSKVITKIKAKSKVKTKVKVAVKSKTKPVSEIKAKVKAKIKAKIAIAKVKKVPVKKIAKPKAIKAEKKAVSRTQKLALRRSRKAAGPVNVRPYQSKHNEEYMNDGQLAHFRNVLLQWKEQLMAEADRTMHNMQDKASNYPDPVDRASQEEEFSLELRARDRERKLLRKIEETLNRISDHDYGYCDECGAEIGIRRLEARPTATQCIECKTIAEIREKQIGESNQ